MFIISYNYVNIQTKCYNTLGAIPHPNKLECFPHVFNELSGLLFGELYSVWDPEQEETLEELWGWDDTQKYIKANKLTEIED